MYKIIVSVFFALFYILMSKLLSFEIVVFIALGTIVGCLCNIENKTK